ncbi:MAG: HDIG domain-containing protein [Patescibacteria group bacterium]|jgi:putative nucleotidyltransferase with HDIG domain|nr:HDIG domain-containing protein [Patescibacteria group bacterium]
MDRAEAYELLKQHMKDPANLNHSRESEVIMRALARKFGGDQEYWGNLGLLHDIDWEYGEQQHCRKCWKILAAAGFDDEFIETIVSHGYGFAELGQDFAAKQRQGDLQHLLAAAETITGLIYASALVRPDKKLESVEARSIKKKMKDKSFAAKVDREVIKECEQAGIMLDDFIELSLKAVKEIAAEIGV